jgi:hypothetical protein
MTLLEIPSESLRERSIPVLETKRLVLRAPRLGDVKTLAALANDRRIAENTARIPHPYRSADAEEFIASANRGNDTAFLITQRNGQGNAQVVGACGFSQLDRHPPEIGYWLGVKHWGKGYATEAVRAMIDPPSPISIARRCNRLRASPIRPRAGCWRNAAFNGPAPACCVSARLQARRRSTVSVLTAGFGLRSRAGARRSGWRESGQSRRLHGSLGLLASSGHALPCVVLFSPLRPPQD